MSSLHPCGPFIVHPFFLQWPWLAIGASGWHFAEQKLELLILFGFKNVGYASSEVATGNTIVSFLLFLSNPRGRSLGPILRRMLCQPRMLCLCSPPLPLPMLLVLQSSHSGDDRATLVWGVGPTDFQQHWLGVRARRLHISLCLYCSDQCCRNFKFFFCR